VNCFDILTMISIPVENGPVRILSHLRR